MRFTFRQRSVLGILVLLISSRASSAFFHLVKGFFSTVGVSSQLISWFIIQYLHSSDQLAKVPTSSFTYILYTCCKSSNLTGSNCVCNVWCDILLFFVFLLVLLPAVISAYIYSFLLRIVQLLRLPRMCALVSLFFQFWNCGSTMCIASAFLLV